MLALHPYTKEVSTESSFHLARAIRTCILSAMCKQFVLLLRRLIMDLVDTWIFGLPQTFLDRFPEGIIGLKPSLSPFFTQQCPFNGNVQCHLSQMFQNLALYHLAARSAVWPSPAPPPRCHAVRRLPQVLMAALAGQQVAARQSPGCSADLRLLRRQTQHQTHMEPACEVALVGCEHQTTPYASQRCPTLPGQMQATNGNAFSQNTLCCPAAFAQPRTHLLAMSPTPASNFFECHHTHIDVFEMRRCSLRNALVEHRSSRCFQQKRCTSIHPHIGVWSPTAHPCHTLHIRCQHRRTEQKPPCEKVHAQLDSLHRDFWLKNIVTRSHAQDMRP